MQYEYFFEKFSELADTYTIRISDIICKHCTNADIPIVLVGHSLGATLAEAAVALLEKQSKTTRNCSAITFDSPGQPAYWRKEHMSLPMKNVMTLNSVFNIVNTLNKPCAEKFYSCGTGSRIPFSGLLNVVKQNLKLSLSSAFRFAVESHPMPVIINYLMSRNIVHEDPDSWPLFSGYCIKKVDSVVEYLTPLNNEPRIQEFTPRRNLQRNSNSKGNFSIPTFPEDGITTPNSIYCAYDTHDWHHFLEIINPSDILMPIFGTSGAGKSTTLNKILNLGGSDQKIPCGGGTNNSTNIYIVDFLHSDEERLFLLDMPGLGAQAQSTETNSFIQNSIEPLLNLACGNIGCALFILKDNLLDGSPIFNIIDSLKQNGNIEIQYCYNVNLCENNEQRVEHYKKQLPKPGSDNILEYNPFNERGHSIDELKNGIIKFYDMKKVVIRKNIIKQREKYQNELYFEKILLWAEFGFLITIKPAVKLYSITTGLQPPRSFSLTQKFEEIKKLYNRNLINSPNSRS